MAAVISVENLSKRYLVGHRADRGGVYRYTALRDVLDRGLHSMARKATDFVRGRQIVQGDSVEEFWALKDVSFEVSEGEVLGIIGKNGAGKSTLLKVLSRITEPTSGRVTLRGRVASLLEVGTGFHPELTGRENIFLNGAILGMTRVEIRKKFDEIVAFAGIDKFIDTPVKRYSSGMYVRLAFAVAAHLEPEILVVDEVLAVGDAEFQKKCLGKMNDVAHYQGRTVLLVSHNMAAVAELADRAILLEKGSVALDGSVADAVSAYFPANARDLLYFKDFDTSQPSPFIARVEVVTSSPGGIQKFGSPMSINVLVRHVRPLLQGHLGIQIINQFHVPATAVYAYPPVVKLGTMPGETEVRFRIPRVGLNKGRYSLRIWLTEAPGELVYEKLDACAFEVAGHPIPWFGADISTYEDEFSCEIALSDHSTSALRSRAVGTTASS